MPLPGKTKQKFENNYTTLPDHNKQKYDDTPLSAKKKHKSEGRTTARKMYTNFIHINVLTIH